MFSSSTATINLYFACTWRLSIAKLQRLIVFLEILFFFQKWILQQNMWIELFGKQFDRRVCIFCISKLFYRFALLIIFYRSFFFLNIWHFWICPCTQIVWFINWICFVVLFTGFSFKSNLFRLRRCCAKSINNFRQ